MGVQISTSQLFGAGEHERMRATFATSIISLMILVVIASVIGYFASGTILELMNTPPEIIADSKAYLDEIFKGLIFMFLYNLYTCLLYTSSHEREVIRWQKTRARDGCTPILRPIRAVRSR